MTHEKESLHIYAQVATEVADRARRIRRSSLRMVHAAGMGHPGGDLSCADILAALFFHTLRARLRATRRIPTRDRFILSKGHASAALYATLAERGVLPARASSRPTCSRCRALNGHPDRNKVPGVEANTGPLGHGLPIAVGMALGREDGSRGAGGRSC